MHNCCLRIDFCRKILLVLLHNFVVNSDHNVIFLCNRELLKNCPYENNKHTHFCRKVSCLKISVATYQICRNDDEALFCRTLLQISLQGIEEFPKRILTETFIRQSKLHKELFAIHHEDNHLNQVMTII